MGNVPDSVLAVAKERKATITFETSKGTDKDAKVIYFDDVWVVLELSGENTYSYYTRENITGYTIRQKHLHEEIMKKIQQEGNNPERN